MYNQPSNVFCTTYLTQLPGTHNALNHVNIHVITPASPVTPALMSHIIMIIVITTMLGYARSVFSIFTSRIITSQAIINYLNFIQLILIIRLIIAHLIHLILCITKLDQILLS